MTTREIDTVNTDGKTYSIEPIVTRVIEQGNHLPATSGALYQALAEAQARIPFIQPKVLETPVIVAGVQQTTVESAIVALDADLEDTVDSPASGNQKYFSSQGAFNDKTDDPMTSGTKNFTAGGAYEWFGHCSTAQAWLTLALGNHL